MELGAGSNILTFALPEPNSSEPPQTICGGNIRERQVYLSTTETVEVRMYKSSQNLPKRFLLKYEGKNVFL